ncbi:hypothetical protein POM88_016289 [Heracleum sosnowskyi]|uniref:Uncharacterized protein n=1 Tax=Heracleum sosnowskyi TaxID=360622 RepID=A0AAD8MWS0_9APIA|nr:hypothetical protein POM88_016289 [Heracleum sosnowskyi]
MKQKDTFFCNKPLKKLHKAMEMSVRARPSWNGGNKYLVTMTDGGRPKKKKDKTNDIVEKRASDPTMMKRTRTSLKCGWCNEWGHNTRTCNSKRVDQENNSAIATHGGIIRPFKPPTQKKGPNCMDVEAVEGQKFTSLKNLQATRSMMQKNMGKRKD